mmetsp:Transcript_11638/g.49736  ORF Transcript_11638/g.49736 Transcript_11638/m.49736 type:complete len:743 (+) Transcript_11638:999-3227(+)
MSCSRVRRASHGTTRSMKGIAKGDARIACVLTMCSSSSVCASSMGAPSMMHVPVAFQSFKPNTHGFQSAIILSSAFSKLNSRDATSEHSAIFSRWSSTPLSRSFFKLVWSSRLSSNPTTSITSVIAIQCRSLRPGLHTASIKGWYVLKSSIFASVAVAALSGSGSRSPPVSPLNTFCSLNMIRYASCTASSIVSGTSVENGPVSQSRWLRNMLLVVCHSFLNGSKEEICALICGAYLVGANENSRSSALISWLSVSARSIASAKASTLLAIASRSTTSPKTRNSAISFLCASSASANALRRAFTSFSNTLYSFSTVTEAFKSTALHFKGHPLARTLSSRSSSDWSRKYSCRNSSRAALNAIAALSCSSSAGRNFMYVFKPTHASPVSETRVTRAWIVSYAATIFSLDSRAAARMESVSASAIRRAASASADLSREQSTLYAPHITRSDARFSMVRASARNASISSLYSGRVFSASAKVRACASASIVSRRRCGSNRPATPRGAMAARSITTCTARLASAMGESSSVAEDNAVFGFGLLFSAAISAAVISRTAFLGGAGGQTRGTPAAASTKRSSAPTAMRATASSGGSNRASADLTIRVTNRRFSPPTEPSGVSSSVTMDAASSSVVPNGRSDVVSSAVVVVSPAAVRAFSDSSRTSSLVSSSPSSPFSSSTTSTRVSVSVTCGTRRTTNTGCLSHSSLSESGSASRCSSLKERFSKNDAYSPTRRRTSARNSEDCCVAIAS